MNALYYLMGLFAPVGAGWGHEWGHGGGWMWLWGPLMLALWLALGAGAVWLVARTIKPRERSAIERGTEILAERYARGEITTDEYRERLEQLR